MREMIINSNIGGLLSDSDIDLIIAAINRNDSIDEIKDLIMSLTGDYSEDMDYEAEVLVRYLYAYN